MRVRSAILTIDYTAATDLRLTTAFSGFCWKLASRLAGISCLPTERIGARTRAYDDVAAAPLIRRQTHQGFAYRMKLCT
jgi:hypothetical protein